MAIDLWRRSLARLGPVFENLARTNERIDGILVESMWVYRVPIEPAPRPDGLTGQTAYPTMFMRGMLQPYTRIADGMPRPIPDSDRPPQRRPTAIGPGITQQLYVCASSAALRRYLEISIAAGRILASAPQNAWRNTITEQSMAANSDGHRWLLALFDVALTRPVGTQLAARQWTWSYNERNSMLWRDVVHAAPQEGQPWFSMLIDLPICSASFVDLLTTSSVEDTPELIEKGGDAGAAAVADADGGPEDIEICNNPKRPQRREPVGAVDIKWSTYMPKGNLADILDCNARDLETLYGDKIDQ
jgi:hypothetical protein